MEFPGGASEQVLDHLLDLMSDAVIAVDHDRRVVACNAAARLLLGSRVTGDPADEATGDPVVDVRHALVAVEPRDAEAVRAVVDGEADVAAEVTVEGRAGQQVVVDVRGVDEPWGRVLVLRDHTEQVESQQVLRMVHEAQRELERLGQVGRWQLDRSSGELQWSEQVVELLRLDPLLMQGTLEEFLGLLLEEDRGSLATAITEVTPDSGLDMEVAAVLGDGSDAWLRVRAMVDEAGKDVLRGVVQDVTRLREALETAKRVNADVVRFAGVIAHDLRSPVATIAGMAGLLRERVLDEDSRQQVAERIEANAVGVCEQIDLLLGEAVRTRSRLDPVPLDEVVAWVANLVAAQLSEVNASLTWDALPTVWGRVPLLRQCLLNLVGNAIKYGRPDGGTIHVHATETDAWWEVTVADDGPGIPAEARDRVFGAGFRLHADGTTVGSGIGLAAVRRVMDSLGGDVRVDQSSLLGGAALVLRFPRSVDQPEEVAPG